MEVDGFTLYKGKDFLPCKLTIKGGEIVQYDSDNFKDIFPQENRSALAKIETIKKVHRSERIPNECKYFIQHLIDDEVMNIYLDISRFNYLRLKFGLGKSIFQTKEFIIGLILAVITVLLTAIL